MAMSRDILGCHKWGEKWEGVQASKCVYRPRLLKLTKLDFGKRLYVDRFGENIQYRLMAKA